MMWNIQQAMQDDAIRTARINPAFIPVTGLKFSCGKISSLRSKRFRLVSEQKKKKKNEEREFRFWLREKWNESLSSPPLPALLLAPFFARSLTLVSRSLLLNRTETLTTQATKFPARLRGSRSEKRDLGNRASPPWTHRKLKTKDLEVGRDLGNRASPVLNRAHMKRP